MFTLVCLLPKDSSLIPTASADYLDSVTKGDFSFTERIDGTLEFSHYNGKADSFTVPSKAAGKTVTAVASSALFNMGNYYEYE